MITLRFLHATAECDTVDEAVELLTRYQERPRVVEVLRARAGSLSVKPEATDPASSFGEEFEALAQVELRDTLPAPAPALEDDPAAEREEEARAVFPDAPRPEEPAPEPPRKRTRSEIMRDNWAKRRARQAAEPQRRRTFAPVEDLPPVERARGGQPRRCGVAILTAFERDQNFPLKKLAKHVYGSDDLGVVMKLKGLITTSFVGTGKLESAGENAWRVTARGKEALRLARESAERVSKANAVEAAE